MRYHFVSMESCPKDSHKSIITLESIPNVVARFFGAKSQTLQFRGSSTIWFSFPEFNKQWTLMDGMLYNIWKREGYKAMSAQK